MGFSTDALIYGLLAGVTYLVVLNSFSKLTIPTPLRSYLLIGAGLQCLVFPIIWLRAAYNLIVYRRWHKLTLKQRNEKLQQLLKQYKSVRR